MRVLLLSSIPGDIKFFKDVASKAAMSFLPMASAKQVCNEIKKDPAALIVVDASTAEQYQAFEKCLSDEIGLFGESINANRFFFLGSSDLHETPYLIQSTVFGHFIQRPLKEGAEALVGHLFQRAVSDEMSFGIERYFDADVKVQTIQIKKTTQKRATVEGLKDFLIKAQFQSRIAGAIATAVDEIIMNALFDAPVDETSKSIYAQTPRNTEFELNEKSLIEVKVAYNGKFLGISVLDQYGSLDKKKLLAHISKSYEHEDFKVKTAVAGAGLGLSNVYRGCGGLVVECEMGAKTQVTVFYQKTASFKEFKDQFRFLSTFMYFS